MCSMYGHESTSMIFVITPFIHSMTLQVDYTGLVQYNETFIKAIQNIVPWHREEGHIRRYIDACQTSSRDNETKGFEVDYTLVLFVTCESLSCVYITLYDF